MAYTPALERAMSGFVRRIAWALHIPMTLEGVVLHVAEQTDPEKAYPFCLDSSRCGECFLSRPPQFSRNSLARVLKEE